MNESDLKRYIQKGVNDYLRAYKKSMTEFSKQMVKLYAWACILWISASYVLAAFGKEINDNVTVAVITSLAATLLGYCYKALKENIKKGEVNKKL